MAMLTALRGKQKKQSLMQEYSALLGDAVLRQRARVAENRARIESELANRVKSEFISNMSHELRTPLNTVMGFSKLLSEHGKRKLPDEEIVQYASLIHDAASHLLTVINDILDISKMRSGNYTLEEHEVDVVDVIASLYPSFEAAAAEAGVNLDRRMAHNLPHVRGDERKLGQIIANLLSNAVKFTPKGGNVTLGAVSNADGGVVISIRDTGVGMTEEEIRVALEPFGQVDGSRARWREGTGLGLPIAKALIELHGGNLMITSIKGKGTDVSVLLPPTHQITLSEARAAMFGHGPVI
jgi:two-component system, cell cycle sensor histidine kinase PleC